MTVVELDELPELTGLLARAGLSALPSLGTLPALPWQSRSQSKSDDGLASTRPPDQLADQTAVPPRRLPATQVVVRDVGIKLGPVADYAEVCGFRLGTDVPITYPHMLGFPPVVWLMTRENFPHSLLGLVHVRNQIVAREHLRIGEQVDVAAHIVNERAHDKGVQFDAVVQIRRDDRVVWASTSTYLRRGGPGSGGGSSDGSQLSPDAAVVQSNAQREAQREARRETNTDAQAVDLAALPTTARWQVPSDIGRRYAAVSGDRNPIHLTSLTARGFGFPRAIAHGMWTKAAALAGLGTLRRPCTIDVVFQRPVLLPSTVDYATQRTDRGWDFGLRGRDGTPHLRGRIT